MNEILAVFGINWKLLVVQIVNFGVLLVILYYFLYKRVIALLEQRRQKINEGLLKAEEAAIAHQNIDQQRDEIIATSVAEGERLVKEARTKALNTEQELVRIAHDKEEKIIASAQKKAEEERRRILESAKHELAKAATLGATKILKENK